MARSLTATLSGILINSYGKERSIPYCLTYVTVFRNATTILNNDLL